MAAQTRILVYLIVLAISDTIMPPPIAALVLIPVICQKP